MVKINFMLKGTGVPDDAPTGTTATVSDFERILKSALFENPDIDEHRKLRIIGRMREQYASTGRIDVADGDFEFHFGPSDEGRASSPEQFIAGVLKGAEDGTGKVVHAIDTTNDLLKGYPSHKRRKILRKVFRDQERERRRKLKGHLKELAVIDAEKDFLERVTQGYAEVIDWSKLPLKLERPPATSFHNMRQDMLDGTVLIVSNAGSGPKTDPKEFDDIWEDASVFVVEHDWAAAFDRAGDYAGGEFKLPDEVCAFEFRISGRHLIAIAFEMDGALVLNLIIASSRGWLLPGTVICTDDGRWLPHGAAPAFAEDDPMLPVIELVGRQIKAIAVALDAEVATSEVVRAPHKLNHQRERRGKLPFSSYHVVSLSRRSRAPRLPVEAGVEPKFRMRLHFRRGHWRHYDNHKTWIKWMLVGDPDLGFIDKHYKL